MTVVSGQPVVDGGVLGSIVELVDGWARRTPDTIAVGGLDWRRVPHGSAAVFRTRHLDALAHKLDSVLDEA